MTVDEILITFLNHLAEKPGVVIPDDDVSAAVAEALGATLADYELEVGQELITV